VKKSSSECSLFLKRLPGVWSEPGSSRFHLFSRLYHVTAEPQCPLLILCHFRGADGPDVHGLGRSSGRVFDFQSDHDRRSERSGKGHQDGLRSGQSSAVIPDFYLEKLLLIKELQLSTYTMEGFDFTTHHPAGRDNTNRPRR
jgi:hypothetical protein